jgi:hypothetical protein
MTRIRPTVGAEEFTHTIISALGRLEPRAANYRRALRVRTAIPSTTSTSAISTATSAVTWS